MGELSKLFIEQFHNLPGDTIHEKRRNLFLLIRQHHSALTENEDELELVTTNLKPASYLEKNFRIDFLIHFRRFKELLQDCLDGDELTLTRVIKQDWFFQNAFKNVGAEEFVNNTLSTMPYVFKFKVLKKLPVKEQEADRIFDAILQKYGIYFATIFLPKCSANKIEETLKTQFIKLTDPQLQLLCDKDPNLIYVYFEERSKHEGNTNFMNDNRIFVYVAQRSPEVFAKLFNKYKFRVALGYRTTKKFIESQKDDVLNHLTSYFKILKDKALVKKVGPALPTIFFDNFVSRRKRKFYWNFLLNYYPKRHRFELFKSSYNSKFYHKFGEDIDAVTEEMLKIMDNPTERENLAKLKLEKTNDIKYLQYVTPSYCMKEFRGKLNEMTASERPEYVEHTTACCLLNKDLNTLLELSEIVAVEFKNTDTPTRVGFLYPFDKNDRYKSVVVEFTEQHWKFMMEIIATAHAKEDWVHYDGKIRIKYLEHLINQNKPIKHIISNYSDWANLFEDGHPVKKNKKVYRQILCELLETAPLKTEDIKSYNMTLLKCCREFNRKNRNYAIDIMNYPNVIQTVDDIFEQKSELPYNRKAEIEFVVCRTGSSELLDKFKMLYFKDFDSFGRTSGCLWFIKNEPKTFQKYLNYFLEKFNSVFHLNHRKIWSSIKKYTHSNLDREIVEYCKSKLEANDVLNERLIEALAILSPADHYFELIKTYVKACDKKEVPEDDAEKDSYTTQCNLVKYLHFVKSPATVLPIALQFCKSGFLKYALCPLYCSAYRLPEKQVASLITELNEDETLKVHAIHLSCVLLDLATAYSYLKNTSRPSLMRLSKYLAKNPSDAVWELIEERLPKASKKDLYVFKWIMRKPLHLTYKTKYIEAIWTFLNKHENKEMKIMMFQNKDINMVQNLPPNLAYRLIEENIFKTEDSDGLISSLLIHMNDKDKYEFVKKILGSFKENCWNQKNAKPRFREFIKNVVKTYFETEAKDEEFERNFSEIFTSFFNSSDAFVEFVMVSFMRLKGQNAEDCGVLFVEFNSNLVENYGRAIVNLTAGALKEFVLPNVFKTDDEKMKLCYSILKSKKSLDDYLLIINLLPESEPEDAAQHKLYNEIFNELQQTTDNYILLQFNLYLKERGTNNTAKCGFEPCIAICPCR